MDQEANRYRSILDLPAKVAGLLGHPGTRRVGRAAGQMDPSAPKLDEKQDIQRLQPYGFDGEAVTANHLVLVVRQKRAPAGALLAAFRCRRHMLALEHIANGRAPDGVPELAELPLQLAVAPAWILLRQPQNQCFKFGIGGWPAP